MENKKTEAVIEKEKLILSVIIELSDYFSMKLTDASKVGWVDELMVYGEERIIKTKKLLRSSHKGNLYPIHFHEAISNFKKQKTEPEEDQVKNPIPMPESFKKKYLRMREEWEK